MKDWLKLENRIKATPLDLLEQGVTNRQWEAVDAAYTMLTGKPVFPNTKAEEKPKQEKEVEDEQEEAIEEPEEEVQEDETDDVDDADTDEEEQTDNETEGEEDDEERGEHRMNNRIRTRSSVVNVKGKKNKFVDTGEDAAEDKAFMPPPEKLARRRKQVRPTYKMVKVTCKKCGKTERVDPVLAPAKLDNGRYKMRYVCNDCSCGGT